MSSPLTDADADDSVALLSGDWIAKSAMRIDVDDIGFRQAVTVVERLRTYAGRPFMISRHLDRWKSSCDYLTIDGLPVAKAIIDLIDQLLDRNTPMLDREGDVGITLFATPGILSSGKPTFGLHLNRLNADRNQKRISTGQPVVITDVRQPDNDSWSRSIKTRCRIHYYRADRIAAGRDVDACGVLVDADGTVTESSIANVAIIENGKIVSPAYDQVLHGITQSVVEDLAAEANILWSRDRITPDRLRGADEVLLMGTDAGLWFANRVDDAVIGDGGPGPLFRVLRASFDHAAHRGQHDQ